MMDCKTKSKLPQWMESAGCEALVFDLDGTLIDSAPGIAWALNQALEMAGSSGRVAPSDVGPPLEAMVARAMGPGAAAQSLDRAAKAFKELYDPRAHEAPAFEGVDRALRELASMGVPMGVATNKRERVARLVVESKGWSGFFGLGVLGRESFVDGSGRPGAKSDGLALLCASSSIAPARMARAGDTEGDFEAARAAGFGAFLHCPWGSQPDWSPPEGCAAAVRVLSSASDFL